MDEQHLQAEASVVGQKRIPNFTPQEKQHLINLLSQKYQNKIEDKNTNRTTVEKKHRTWNIVPRSVSK